MSRLCKRCLFLALLVTTSSPTAILICWKKNQNISSVHIIIILKNNKKPKKYCFQHYILTWFHSTVWFFGIHTGKSFSEALILASTNPQYNKRLFMELQVQFMKIPSSEHGESMLCADLFLTSRTISVHIMFSPVLQKEELLAKIYLYRPGISFS